MNDSIMKTAYQNSGQLNSGMGNSGDYNAGDYNSGNRNAGSFNSGDFNLGDYNSGDFNLANGSAGVFCCVAQKIYFFDAPTDLTLDEWRDSYGYTLLSGIRTVAYDGKSVKRTDFKTACRNFWKNLDPNDKKIITKLPNFSRQKFYMVTGIDVCK